MAKTPLLSKKQQLSIDQIANKKLTLRNIKKKNPFFLCNSQNKNFSSNTSRNKNQSFFLMKGKKSKTKYTDQIKQKIIINKISKDLDYDLNNPTIKNFYLEKFKKAKKTTSPVNFNNLNIKTFLKNFNNLQNYYFFVNLGNILDGNCDHNLVCGIMLSTC